MKASELIKRLEAEMETHGDLPVFYINDGAQGELSNDDLAVKTAGNELGFDSKTQVVPNRILIGV